MNFSMDWYISNIFKQYLTVWLRLAFNSLCSLFKMTCNSQSSLRARIIGVCHYAQLNYFVVVDTKYTRISDSFDANLVITKNTDNFISSYK